MLINLNTQKLVRALTELGFIGGTPALAYPIVFFNDGKVVMADITVKDDHGALDAAVSFVDDMNNPTSPDDVPQWSSSDATVADVVAAEDGLSASVSILGPVGAAVIAVTSTDTNGTVLNAQGTVTVVASEAVTGSVSFSDPAPVEPPAPEPAPSE